MNGISQYPIFTSTFGFYCHLYMYENIGTMANEMLNNLDEIIFGNNDTVESGILYSTKEVQK